MKYYKTRVPRDMHKLKHNEVKPFYVVEYPTRDAELVDILFECDPLGLMLQHQGGLEIGNIAGFFTNKTRAEKFAEKLLKEKYAGHRRYTYKSPRYKW